MNNRIEFKTLKQIAYYNYWLFGEVKFCDKIDEFKADAKKVEED